MTLKFEIFGIQKLLFFLKEIKTILSKIFGIIF